jgi:hypothetical protein
MLTAETITDEQIRELRDNLHREHRGRAGKMRMRETMIYIADALRGEDNQRYRGAYYNARCYVAGMLNALARRAEILNARSGK